MLIPCTIESFDQLLFSRVFCVLRANRKNAIVFVCYNARNAKLLNSASRGGKIHGLLYKTLDGGNVDRDFKVD